MNTLEQIILLLISGQGILLSFALLASFFKKKYGAFFFGIIVFVITLEILTNWAISVQYTNQTTAIPFWTLGSYLLIPPALWFFLQSTSRVTFSLPKYTWWFFLPAITEIMVEFISFYLNRKLEYNYQLINNSVWYFFTEMLPVIGMLIVLFLFSKQLYDLQVKLKTASIKDIPCKIGKLYTFLVVFSTFTILWIAVGIFEFQIFYYVQIFMLFFVFAFGYANYFIPTLFDPPKVLSTRILDASESKFEDRKELDRLTDLFESEKIFLEHKLTLKMVAERLQLPQNYVSGLINSYHQSNFNVYVNQYRVEEVKRRLNDPKEKNKTLLAIALDSGFSSKSSFNKTFKEITGKNPSEYLKK